MSESLLVHVIILGLLIVLFPVSIESLRFELKSANTKCISEDIRSNSMTVGKYNVVNPNEGQPLPDTHKLTVRVTSSHGNNYHYSDHVESGQFAFTAAEGGDYMACFWAPDHNPPVELTVDFEWKTGIHAKDWGNVAKKGNIELMEIELKKMTEQVSGIHEDMYYLREREEEMQKLNVDTTSSMFYMGLTSLAVCLGVSGFQLWHLKRSLSTVSSFNKYTRRSSCLPQACPPQRLEEHY
ncbi:hypothetical protein ACFE04_022219 [Oxalis oulophora]